MRSLLFVIASFCVTIVCWGLYLPTLQWGQQAMNPGGDPSRWRSFLCLGLAYFLVGVVVPTLLLRSWGERGEWTVRGIAWSLFGGALGALGALGAILAVNFGGNPLYIAPIVFGCAPIVNSFLTIYLAGKMREIGPVFLAGLVMVALGAVTVVWNSPHGKPKTAAAAAAGDASSAASQGKAPSSTPRSAPTTVGGKASSFVLQVASIALIVMCWGAYGPTLHKGQAAMANSRLRAFICVGLAYFAIAVCLPPIILATAPEPGQFTVSGTLWSLIAGGAGAVGALGIIMAFNFGGKPVYVMPLVFGGAPVVATLVSTASQGLVGSLSPFFLAGLILVIAGSAMVLVFAPKGAPHGAAHSAPVQASAPAPSAEPRPAEDAESPPAPAGG
jgi:hypothetical protein